MNEEAMDHLGAIAPKTNQNRFGCFAERKINCPYWKFNSDIWVLKPAV